VTFRGWLSARSAIPKRATSTPAFFGASFYSGGRAPSSGFSDWLKQQKIDKKFFTRQSDSFHRLQ
jgi:hypothetical protein